MKFFNGNVPDAPWIGDPDGYFGRSEEEDNFLEESDQRWDEQKYEGRCAR